jgi:hypothetical protein
MARPLKERFDEKVFKPEDPDACWVWTACRKADGYGRIGAGPGRDILLAHRAAWMCYRGDIPADLLVLHKCNNGAGGCVNPDHLYVGTYSDNARDRVRAGNNAKQKLTVTDVTVIKARLAEGHLGKDIALDYGVSRTAISRINKDKTFANL